MKKIPFIIFSAVLLAVACKPREGRSFETIDYVKRIAADTTATGGEFGLVRAWNAQGSIAILGEPEEVVFLSENLMNSDRFDNITGRAGNDILPDFAGERIAAILDVEHSPYSHYIPGMETALREVTVRGTIAALDTVCRLNSFNEDALMPKQRAKVLVLGSSVAYACGYADVDTLFKMASRKIPVITPVESMVTRAFEGASGTLNVGVWADETVIASGAYQAAFARQAAKHKDVTASLSLFSPEQEGDAANRLISFLDKYESDGTAFPMSVLLLDDYGINVTVLEAQLSEIRRMETPQMVEYNKLLSPDFRFVDASGSVITDIYRLLRGRNLFTHNIAYPALDVYQTLSAGEHFVLVPSTSKNIPEETLEFIQENTTAVQKHYAVQAKH